MKSPLLPVSPRLDPKECAGAISFPAGNPAGAQSEGNVPWAPCAVKTSSRPGWIRAGAVSLALVLLADLGAGQAVGGPLDWLKSRHPTPKRADRTPELAVSRNDGRKDLPGFFSGKEAGPEITGAAMNPLKFAEAHWLHAKTTLEKVTRTIQAKIQEKKCSDLVAKLFVIDMQTYREVLKTAATGILAIDGGLRGVEGSLTELHRIITAPQQETLDNLEKALSRLQGQNAAMGLQARSFLAGVEGMISLSQEAFQTLELIPALSLPAIDSYVQASKQVMHLAQSSSEALKGLLLNVQTGSEEVSASLELMVSTIRTTLRFSDHFAFRQFPLVNLPVPTREKLFSQLGALKNSARGIRNTLSIGDSHLKNSAQQFTHLTQSAVAKIGDALKYQGSTEYGVENLPQISGYSHNQVCGLYQRVKEGITEMKVAMGKAARPTTGGGAAPTIAIENEEQFLARKSQVVGQKLPLFLLGSSSPASGKTGVADGDLRLLEPKGEMKVLYSEPGGARDSAPVRENLLPDEVDILQQELGSLIPGVGEERVAGPGEGAEEASRRPSRKSRQDLIPPTGDLEAEETSLAQAAVPSDAGDDGKNMDLLRMEATPTGDSGDLIPMFRLEDFSPPPEKE